jgi:hypothetical protein
VQYNGEDAGYLVIAMGQMPDTSFMDYAYKYRPLNQSGDDGAVGYYPGNMTVKRVPDFTNIEGSGIVEVLKMQPGTYEFYNIAMVNDNGMSKETYQFRKDFSIPFTIKSGQADYAGHFLAQEIQGRNIFFMPVPAGARFLISDQAPADLKTARTPRDKLVMLPLSAAVTDSTPNVHQLNNPLFLPDPAAPEQ